MKEQLTTDFITRVFQYKAFSFITENPIVLLISFTFISLCKSVAEMFNNKVFLQFASLKRCSRYRLLRAGKVNITVLLPHYFYEVKTRMKCYFSLISNLLSKKNLHLSK